MSCRLPCSLLPTFDLSPEAIKEPNMRWNNETKPEVTAEDFL